MSDSQYSEHESENSFDKNKDNEIDNLDKLFKRMGLEHYRFEPTKKKKKRKITGREQSDSKKPSSWKD